jgi:hypothetical protein
MVETMGSYETLLIVYHSGSQPLSDRGSVNSFFYKTRVRYNGPAVEKHWSTRLRQQTPVVKENAKQLRSSDAVMAHKDWRSVLLPRPLWSASELEQSYTFGIHEETKRRLNTGNACYHSV